MKIKKILLLIILGLLSASVEVRADENSETVLAKLRAKVRSYASYQLDFTAAVQEEGVIKGSLTVSGGKFVAKVMGQNLYCDGSTLWVHIPRQQEVTIERLDPNNHSALSNPSKLLDISPEDYNHRTLDPVATAKGVATKGRVLQVIELIPKSKMPDYSSLTLYIDPATSLPERISIVTTSSEMPVELVLGELRSNISVTASTFRFNTEEHPSVEVIDFR